MSSRAFGGKGPSVPHLDKHGIGGQVNDLRRDVEEAFESLEASGLFGQVATLTQPGASPFEVVFLDQEMRNMAGTQYAALLDTESDAKIKAGSKTTAGLTIIGGDIGTVYTLVLIGLTA